MIKEFQRQELLDMMSERNWELMKRDDQILHFKKEVDQETTVFRLFKPRGDGVFTSATFCHSINFNHLAFTGEEQCKE